MSFFCNVRSLLLLCAWTLACGNLKLFVHLSVGEDVVFDISTVSSQDHPEAADTTKRDSEVDSLSLQDSPPVVMSNRTKGFHFHDNNNKLVTKLFEAPKESFPAPMQVLREYIEQHGVHTEPHKRLDWKGNRKYLLLEYSFPDRAGNMYAIALNTILLGVLTNRTLIWQFDCKLDSKAECDRFFRRAEWVPVKRPGCPAVLWSPQEEIRAGCKELFNTRSTIICKEKLRDAPDSAYEKLSSNVQNKTNLALRGIAGCLTSDISGWHARFDARVPSCRRYLDVLFGDEIVDQNTIDRLFAHGIDYLYGMLFRHTFELTDELVDSVETTGGTFDPNAFSIALHSRHSAGNALERRGAIDSGEDITNEKRCLDRVLASNKASKCQILIMSDREATNTAVASYAKEHGCEGLVVEQDKIKHLRQEHGPFAGLGFWKDMVLVTKARNGFVATTRSSSFILLILMAYDRAMERLAKGEVVVPSDQEGALFGEPLHGLDICFHQYEQPPPKGLPASS